MSENQASGALPSGRAFTARTLKVRDLVNAQRTEMHEAEIPALLVSYACEVAPEPGADPARILFDDVLDLDLADFQVLTEAIGGSVSGKASAAPSS